MLCRMKFAANIVQTETLQFMYLGFSTINTLDESGSLRNPATRIRRPVDGAHWSAPNHIFGESKAVGVIEAKSDYD